ncbi:hypothetical protein [Exiguobacterium acetylicum]|uniref:Type II secretion system protein GspF domain-containing protein n=1 Tax=Exiguobacterium acetylicum TaxID=41170 RepID=A0ABX8GFS0_EXIAC|nr:hypothetical protein [Exiguobacterium acetylicum]QWB31992.1 hypothetical protein KKI46_17685 [Exiguobacterium acetylicum]
MSLSNIDYELVRKVLSIVALLAIGVLAYRVVNQVSDLRSRKRFVLKSFLQEGQEEQSQTYPLLERITSFDKYRVHVETKLKEARSPQTFEKFMMKRLIHAAICIVYLFGMGFMFDVSIFYYLALPIAFYVSSIPMKQLTKAQIAYTRQKRLELPTYLSSFIILLKDFTPLDALRKSVDYAGSTLKPFVETLITEVELYPADNRAYRNFIKNVDIKEAEEFIMAFQQMQKISVENSSKILEFQLETMDELQDETYEEVSETRMDTLDRNIRSMMIPYVAIIFSLLGILMVDTFGQMSVF